jgi:glycine cleavage system H protein
MRPSGLKYTKEHEWVGIEGGTATVGITDYAQEQLTDIVFVELPEIGRKVGAGDPVAVVESVKSVSDVYSPVAGEVSEVNKALEAHPEKVNEDPFGEGWILKLRVSKPDLSGLMDAAAYQKFLDEQEH